MAYIIDASVACRFVLIEDLTDKAELLLEGFLRGAFDLKAPKLIVYEVGNTLWKATRQKLVDVGEAVEKFSYFLRLELDSVELNEDEREGALGWAVKMGTTYYDSVYVRSSKKTGVTFLTADDALYQKARREVPTIHLKDYEG